MSSSVRSEIRSYVTQRLRMHGDLALFDDNALLFTSGRLDSLDAIEIIVTLESNYGLRFSDIDFDLTLLDSIDSIVSLVDRNCRQMR